MYRNSSEKDLDQDFDGLVLPGGESTVQGKLLWELELFDELKKESRMECLCSVPVPV